MVVKRREPASDAPREGYDTIRHRVRDGDILLFQGKGWVSRIIRWGSDSTYSHAGLTAWWGERLLVFQSAGRGVEVLPVSSAVYEYDGQVDWWVVKREREAELDRGELLRHAVTQLGTPYAKTGVLELMWRMAIGKFRGRRDPRVDPEGMFCSQYVSYCYRKAGLDLRPDTDDACTSPGDLATCGVLENRAVLHYDREVHPEEGLPAHLLTPADRSRSAAE